MSCFLDVVQADQRLPTVMGSCFSEDQVDSIFQEWCRFASTQKRDIHGMCRKLNRIEEKFSFLTSARSGVDGMTPALNMREEQWVVQNPVPTASPFIQYLRQNASLMHKLNLSFKPLLQAPGLIRKEDIVAILERFSYWMSNGGKQLTILGVSEPMFPTLDTMIRKLRTEFYSTTFHVAAVLDDERWLIILIDRTQSTIELYDPAWQSATENSVFRGLLQTLIDMGQNPMSKMPDRVSQVSRRDCSVLSLMFLQDRLTKNRTFEQVTQDIQYRSKKNCNSFLNLFFRTAGYEAPGAGGGGGVSDHQKWILYDTKVAAMKFAAYLESLIMVSDAQKQAFLTDKIQQIRSALTSASGNARRYIQNRLYEIQSALASAMPMEFRAEMWTMFQQQVMNDGYSQHLRGMSSSERVQKVRQDLNDLMPWRFQVGIDPVALSELDALIRQWIDFWYVGILNEREFYVGMTADNFVMAAAKNQLYVGFVVHLMRQIYKLCIRLGKYPVNSILSTTFPDTDMVAKPMLPMMLGQYKTELTQCDQALQAARNFLAQVAMQNQILAPPALTPILPAMGAINQPLLPAPMLQPPAQPFALPLPQIPAQPLALPQLPMLQAAAPAFVAPTLPQVPKFPMTTGVGSQLLFQSPQLPAEFKNRTIVSLVQEALDRMQGADSDENYSIIAQRMRELYLNSIVLSLPGSTVREWDNIKTLVQEAVNKYGKDDAAKEIFDNTIQAWQVQKLIEYLQQKTDQLPSPIVGENDKSKARRFLYVFIQFVFARYALKATAANTQSVWKSVQQVEGRLLASPDIVRQVVSARIDSLYDKLGLSGRGESSSIQAALAQLGGMDQTSTMTFDVITKLYTNFTPGILDFLRDDKNPLPTIPTSNTRDKVLLFLYCVVTYLEKEVLSSTSLAAVLPSKPEDRLEMVKNLMRGLKDQRLQSLKESRKFEVWYFPLDTGLLRSEERILFGMENNLEPSIDKDLEKLSNDKEFQQLLGLNVFQVMKMINEGRIKKGTRERDLTLVARSLYQHLMKAEPQAKPFYCQLIQAMKLALESRKWSDDSPSFQLLSRLSLFDCSSYGVGTNRIDAVRKEFESWSV